jgi:pimeloyl-ACP methyl ester carboxylesterase
MTIPANVFGGLMSTVEPAIIRKDATVLGCRIHYLEAGRGDPVILLHGMGGEGARWMPTIRSLASQFRVIAPDQIGFGQSDKPLTTYHRGVFGGFLVEFMQAIAVPSATLIAQSMGVGVALYVAVHHAQMVARLVLVNGAGLGLDSSPPAQPDWHARQIANAGTLEESRDYLEKLYFDRSLVTDSLVRQNLILRLRSAFTIESMQTANARGLGRLTEEELRQIRIPTLLVWGMNDPLSPVQTADKLHAAIKGSRKALIDKAGHFPFLEHPERFNQVVIEFLRNEHQTDAAPRSMVREPHATE